MIKKTAFTMAETIVVLIIIGFFMLFTIPVISQHHNNLIKYYGQTYYSVFEATRKIAYNILADIHCVTNNLVSTSSDCKKYGSNSSGARPFPSMNSQAFKNYMKDTEGVSNFSTEMVSKYFCKRFTDFLNINPNSNHCTDGNVAFINETASNFDATKPHFISTNSLRYYISVPYTFRYCEGSCTSCTTAGVKEFTFFIVYVDINASKEPNTMEYTIEDNGKMTYPDIVPIIVTEFGEVSPAGLPVFSKIYLSAKYNFPSLSSATSPASTSEQLTYNEAVHKAWGKMQTAPDPANNKKVVGCDIDTDIPLSIDYNWFLYKNYSELKFLSFYDKDKNKDNGKDIISKCTDNKDDNTYLIKDHDDSSKDKCYPPIDTSKYCQEHTYNCKVVVDSYSSRRY